MSNEEASCRTKKATSLLFVLCLEERGSLSMQQDVDQQVPVCNTMGRYGLSTSTSSDHQRRFISSPKPDTTTTSFSDPHQARRESAEFDSMSQMGNVSSSHNLQSSAVLHHSAVDSQSSNYMSLYLRLVYWKQEFNYVHLKVTHVFE